MLKIFKKAFLIAFPILISLLASAKNPTQAQIRGDINQKISETIYDQYKKNWPKSEIELNIGQINPAIKLKGCRNIVAILPLTHENRFTVKVKCLLTINEEDAKWVLNVNTRVTQNHPVIVSNKMISKGTLISKEHVSVQMRDITRAKGRFFTEHQDVVGSYTRRNIKNNALLNSHHIITPKDISKNDLINIVSGSEIYKIKTMGKALDSGNIGEQIKVMNIKSEKIIYCVIIDSNTVKPI